MEPQIKTFTPTEEPNLGANLKRLRQERNWSVQKLADQSGLPQSTLSKVENGMMSLNFEKLLLIAETMEIDVGRLFESPADLARQKSVTGRRTIDRASNDKLSETEHYRFRHLSTGLKSRLMIPILFEVASVPKDDELPMMNLIGERFAYVIQGPVEFHCEHYETATLQTGDSIYVDAAMPHAFVAPQGQTAKIISLLTSKDAEYLELARKAALEGTADASETFKQLHPES